jgi:hypothetical protein
MYFKKCLNLIEINNKTLHSKYKFEFSEKNEVIRLVEKYKDESDNYDIYNSF